MLGRGREPTDSAAAVLYHAEDWAHQRERRGGGWRVGVAHERAGGRKARAVSRGTKHLWPDGEAGELGQPWRSAWTRDRRGRASRLRAPGPPPPGRRAAALWRTARRCSEPNGVMCTGLLAVESPASHTTKPSAGPQALTSGSVMSPEPGSSVWGGAKVMPSIDSAVWSAPPPPTKRREACRPNLARGR